MIILFLNAHIRQNEKSEMFEETKEITMSYNQKKCTNNTDGVVIQIVLQLEVFINKTENNYFVYFISTCMSFTWYYMYVYGLHCVAL